MIVTRGPQGAGKTTTMRELGLMPYVLGGDAIRGLLAAPVLGVDGRLGISQDHERRVWGMLFDLLGSRMSRGELVVVDATHRRASDFGKVRSLAAEHRYEVLCLDFSTVPLERCLAQNAARDPIAVVPETVLRNTWEACQRGQVPDDIRRVLWGDDGGHLAEVRAFLDVPVRDLSDYEGVLHIGDLQGCSTPVFGPGGLLEHGPRPGWFHVFVGDLCDRGVENDAVVRHMLELAGRDDVAIVWGNHEDHLLRFARGQVAHSTEFEARTAPQLRAAGITPEDVARLLAPMVEAFPYRWRGHQVLVTHAGLSVVPERLVAISSLQLAKGTGHYNDPVDARFDRLADPAWAQVHGHRNPSWLPVQASPRSFNLEGGVEVGGWLRAVALSDDGWTPIEIASTVFRSLGERVAFGMVHDSRLLPTWADASLPARPTVSDAWLTSLQEHDHIKARPSTSRPHIASYNFTRDAFLRKQWDATNLTARGLFVDHESREIAARSYDKFFNVGERPETRMEALETGLVFPVTLYVKENGYLGIVGYDATQDSLLYASKSSLESEHAEWLRERLEAALSPGQLDALRVYLRDTHTSLVFEVIEPERDPHPIDYDAPRLVLLDVIRRHPTFQRLDHDRLIKLGKSFGLEVKERAMSFEDFAGFARFVEVCSAPDWTWRGSPVEGFVIEDSAGFQTKLKLHYYAFWKRLRGIKDRVLRIRGTTRPLQRDLSDPAIRAFHDWAVTQPDEVLAQDIGRVRKRYLGDGGVEPVAARVAPVAPDPAVVGFERALQGLASAVEAGAELKDATARQLLGRALEHDGVAAVLAAHPLRDRLLLAVSDPVWRAEAGEALGVDLDATEAPL
jgi:predicted kinase